MNDYLQEYFKAVRSLFLKGNFTEYTYRTPFETLINNLKENYNLTHEPKRSLKLGAPDFIAFNKKIRVGYIETKDINKQLEIEIESDQIKKYKKSINNIIITNYWHFILIRNDEKIFDLNLFNLQDLQNSKFIVTENSKQKFYKLLETFFNYVTPTIKSARELAQELSKKARLLKDLAKEQLDYDVINIKNNKEVSSIYDFYIGIKELIKEISIDDCADSYAQTITYGLFLAKINSPERLDKRNASSYIPKEVGIIKRLFLNIYGYSIPNKMQWIIDDIIDILNASDIKGILSSFNEREKKDRDPYSFFYEDFLTLYDPEKRKGMGVFYTKRPIVNFIAKSVNSILKENFNKLNGFAEDDVTVLDPAVGTGTFLSLIFIIALVELKNKGLVGLI